MTEGPPGPAGVSDAPGHGLPLIMRSALRGCHGDLALVALRIDDQRLVIEAGLGPLAEDMVGNVMLVQDSVAAPVLLDGRPLLVLDYPHRGAAQPGVRERIGSVIVAPLQALGRVEGALAVGRLVGSPDFAQSDLDQLAAFVRRTGTARELQGARAERRTARFVEERARIRDDLHDNVIQQLFATGMALRTVAERVSDVWTRELVLDQIDALDDTVARIRALISDLPAGEADTAALPLTKRLVAIVDSLTPALRCLPTVAFVGPVEASVGGELAEDLEATLREALSNVARHAGASAVHVRVAVSRDRLALEVIDDGCGIGEPIRASGLANMRRRASRHGGTLRLAKPPGGGTRVTWDVATS